MTHTKRFGSKITILVALSLLKTATIEAPALAQKSNDFEANNLRVADDPPSDEPIPGF